MIQRSLFRYFKTLTDVIRLAVRLYVRIPLSLRSVENLLHDSGIEVSHETVRFWWQRFGPMFASGCCQGLQARSYDRDLSRAEFIKATGHGYRTERPET